MKHLHKKICILLLAFIVVFSNCIIVSANLISSEGFTTTVVISTNYKNFKKGEEVVFKVNITEQTKLPKLYTFAARIVFNSNQLKLKELRASRFGLTKNPPIQEEDYVYGAMSLDPPPTIGTVNEIVFEALQDHKDMGSVTVGLKDVITASSSGQATSFDGHVTILSIPTTPDDSGTSPTPTTTPDDSGTSPAPTSKPEVVLPACTHLFQDYNYTNPIVPNQVTLYGNGATAKVGDVKNYSKTQTLYTDISPSYQYTLDKKGKVKPSIGKVIVGITSSNTKPTLTKGKIVDASTAKLAKATIRHGQITVTAVGKEQGTVYLWIIDTGNKGLSECCPISVQLAPKKLEVQNTNGKKVTSLSVTVGESAKVAIAGIVSGTKKTSDPIYTYTATVASAFESYVKITPVSGTTQFQITGLGLKNSKHTKVPITFTCDQNGKKIKFYVIVKR